MFLTNILLGFDRYFYFPHIYLGLQFALERNLLLYNFNVTCIKPQQKVVLTRMKSFWKDGVLNRFSAVFSWHNTL